MKRISPTTLTSFFIILILAAGIFWYVRSLNSPLEILTTLNPRNAGNANVSTIIDTSLHSVELMVPEQWKKGVFRTQRTLELPEGFHISVFASGFSKARFMALHPDGTLFLTDSDAGTVLALPDTDSDGVADKVVIVAKGLSIPHGIVFHHADLYIAETGRVIRLRDTNGDYQADEQQTIVPNLPTGGGHVTRSLALGEDDSLYVSVGSSCNACVDDERRADVLRFSLDGSNEEVFASGLRNSVGLAFHPLTGELWATDNGRDLLGDDIPPDEVNILLRGKDYGWPYCYGEGIPDPSLGNAAGCQASVAPTLQLQAHSAPLGLRFYTGSQFPAAYQHQLFIGFHGSWNRREPTGYKVVVANLSTSNAPTITDFIRGWFDNDKAWGRPVDMLVAPDGSLFVSDDSAGAVYRVSYQEPPSP